MLAVTQPCWPRIGSSGLTTLARHTSRLSQGFLQGCPLLSILESNISHSHHYFQSRAMASQNTTSCSSQTSALPSNFLSSPPPKPTKTKIDFYNTLLPEYTGSYAVIIDDAFTPSECAQLIKAAEARNNGVWEQAMINVGNYQQTLMLDARDCGRIIWDDHAVVEKIWSRVKDLVPEIHMVKDKPGVTGWGPAKRKETMQMTRLNERMRFLRYGEGQYFRPHFDGSFKVPGGDEISLYTLHLYLNGAGDESEQGMLKGGATTFHSDDERKELDVEPKMGRVLIFQHRGLLHSGADVKGGLKYTLRMDLIYRKVREE
jgi:hypothetical protein